jgi:FMN-dependent NADH-azoreductase
MSTILALTSSSLGPDSVSSRLVEDAVARLVAAEPGSRIIRRDLGAEPVPHFGPVAAAALGAGEPGSEDERAARALSDRLIDELREADVIVIGAPMYNFGIPSTLKAWFDHVLRAGVTFRYTEAGPEGLLKGKRAIVVLSRGGLYSEGPAQAMDSQEPHLRTMLTFIGITDVAFVRAERLAFGAEARDAAIAAARTALEDATGLMRRAA